LVIPLKATNTKAARFVTVRHSMLQVAVRITAGAIGAKVTGFIGRKGKRPARNKFKARIARKSIVSNSVENVSREGLEWQTIITR